MIHSELEWVPVRSTQRKELVQITESNALDVIAAVGGAVHFERGSKPRLSAGGTARIVGQWVDKGGTVWPDPHDAGAPFEPERYPTEAMIERAAEAMFFEDCGEAVSDEYRVTEDFDEKFRKYARVALVAALGGSES